MRRKIYAIIGASGAGKSTLALELKKYNIFPAIGNTTREQRPNEVAGKDYIFWTKEDFSKKADKSDFVAVTLFDEHYYGIEKSEFLGDIHLRSVIIEPMMIEHYLTFCRENHIGLTTIYLTADREIRKSRMLSDRKDIKLVEKRLKNDRISDIANDMSFDYIFDTGLITPTQIARIILKNETNQEFIDAMNHFVEKLEKDSLVIDADIARIINKNIKDLLV